MTIRYPLDALRRRTGCPSVNALGVRLGVSGTTLQDYERRGLTARVADRLAVRAGYHPAQVWESWVDDALTEVDRAFLSGGWRQVWLWNEGAVA